MQRADADGIVLLCDFCRREWDGQEAMVEGHHGSIICLECVKLALEQSAQHADKYRCTLCLRFNIPPELPRWSNAAHPEAVACQDCIRQAAGALSKSPHTDWELPLGPS